MLILGEKDIKECLSYESCMEAIEGAYKIFKDGNYYMPPRPCIERNEDTLLYMPCFIPDVFATKFLTLFPNNFKHKKPMIDGLVILNDDLTGETKAILNGRILTAIRTGANTGVGIKYTTDPQATTVGLIGAGVQGFYQLIYACYARPIKKAYIYDAYAKDLSKFIELIKPELPNNYIEIEVVDNVNDLIQKSKIIICATTAKTPVLPNDPTVLKGKNVVAIGSYKPDVRECPDALIEVADQVYTDLDFAKEESGDLLIPIETGLLDTNSVIQLSDLIYDEKYQDYQIPETTFFKAVGMALFDVAVAKDIYDIAKAEDKGTKVEI